MKVVLVERRRPKKSWQLRPMKRKMMMSLQVNSLPCVAAWTLCDLMAFMLIRKYGLPFPPSLSAGSHFYPGCLGHPVFGNEWQEGYFVQGPLHSWYCFCGCYSWVAFSLKRNGKLKKKKKNTLFPHHKKYTQLQQIHPIRFSLQKYGVSKCVCLCMYRQWSNPLNSFAL